MLIWVDIGNRVVDTVWLPMCVRNKGHAIQGRDEPEEFGVFARSLFKLEPAVRKDTEDRLSEYDIKHLLTCHHGHHHHRYTRFSSSARV